jgi:hypothetical protein
MAVTHQDFNQMYYSAQGLSFIKGLDSFKQTMPKSRARELYQAIVETKGFEWAGFHFVKWLVAVSGRSHREDGLFPPKCKENCNYRQKYCSASLQVNALRVEIFSPSDRCGWNLKPGRVGGRPDDYFPCTFSR